MDEAKQEVEEVKEIIIGDFNPKRKFLSFVSAVNGAKIRYIRDIAFVKGEKLSGMLEGAIFKITICDEGTIKFEEQEETNLSDAAMIQRLIDEIKLTQEQMSERVGKKRSTIANYLRLLKLDPIIQTGMRDGFISMGHGRALINIENQEAQSTIYHTVVTQNLSVRETEALVKKYQEGLKPKTGNTSASKSFEIATEQKKTFANFFGAKVDINVAPNGKGKIAIPFHSEEDFNRILKLINS